MSAFLDQVVEILHLARHDLLVRLDGRVVKERRVSLIHMRAAKPHHALTYSAHLVDEDAQSPPVNSTRVAFAEDNLRRQVLRGAA